MTLKTFQEAAHAAGYPARCYMGVSAAAGLLADHDVQAAFHGAAPVLHAPDEQGLLGRIYKVEVYADPAADPSAWRFEP